MTSTKYYLSQSNNPICKDCADESELESGRPLKERRNDTGDVLECIACNEEIPTAGRKQERSVNGHR